MSHSISEDSEEEPIKEEPFEGPKEEGVRCGDVCNPDKDGCMVREFFSSPNSLSVGSTYIVQEEGRFISNLYRLSIVGQAGNLFDQLQVMPFGLTNAPTAFTDLVNQVCKPYLNKFVIVFIDNILIYSKSKEDHDVHLKLVLELLKKEKLFGKFSKYEFWLQEVRFLEHVVNNNDVHMDSKQEEASQTLKDNLCNALIMSLPDGIEDFVVYYDVSNQGLGYVFMQRGKVIAYASRQLKIHEKNYTTHDLELGVVVFTLKTWRHYLYETKNVIYTNHKSLRHIFDQKELNMCRRRRGVQGREHNSKNVTWPGPTNEKKGRWRFSRSSSGYDTNWVIVDRLTKLTHFLATREGYGMEKLARLYIDEIVARHGVPVSIISDQGGRFTSRFWQTLQKALGTRLDMSTAYHPQMDGQSKRTIQTLEDMLRACMIDFGGSWDPQTDRDGWFTSRFWQTLHKALGTRLNMSTTYHPQTDGQSVVRFRNKGKLSSGHDTIHMSNLMKCLANINMHVPLEEIKVDKTLHFVEEPVEIMDRED
nr:hypothetical protein [Tanacetum cinerariifolium]